MTNDVAIGYLLSLAEISGVFIAFGALIGAIQTNLDRSSGRLSHAAATCAIGVVTLLACLLPLLLDAFAVSKLWFYSSIGFLVLIGVGFAAAFLQPDFRENNAVNFSRRPVIATIFWIVLEIPLQLALLFNIFGFLPEYAIAFYLTAVLFNFAESGLFLLLMVFGHSEEKEKITPP